MTDPIADFLARIRNAILARQAEVVAPMSKLKQRLAVVLKDEGYISGYDVREDDNNLPEIVVRLRWPGRERRRRPVIALVRGSAQRRRTTISGRLLSSSRTS